jgi:hypothetical protein
LRVEVIARNNRTAFEVAYTAVDFNRPDDSEFVFKAPRGTVVTQVAPNGDQGAGKGKGDKQSQAKKGAGVPKPNQADQPKFVGKGWSTVVVAKMPGSGTATATGQLGRVLNALPVVSGRWGKGRLLSGTAFSAVLTNDGRIAMGSVQPQLLYNALSK